ncbi:MAG: TonB-dependent receptor plug domain-containing protein, partial [Steroidobacteraceae bacterium]
MLLLKKSLPASKRMLATSIAFVAGAASAQNVPPAKDSSAFEIEEILVTALKYDSYLQQTPVAITVVSGETLEKRGIDNVPDLLRLTPGLGTVNQGAGQQRLVVRGVQSAGEAQAALYYDETPIPGAPSTTNDAGQRMPEARLFDVERIEVLRGPQGTLYGAGSMGGTVRALFKRPTSEFETQLSAGTRTSEEGELGYEASAVVNLPLADTLALRAVGYHVDRGGYIDNTTLKQDDVDDDELSGGRLLLRYSPTDRLTIDAAIHIQREDALVSVWELGAGDYETRVPVQQLVADDFELYNLTLRWDLGFATLTGVSSQFNRDLLATIDTTRFLAGLSPLLAAAFGPSALHQPQEIEDRSHELRLSSGDQGGPFIWTVGAFFEQRDA